MPSILPPLSFIRLCWLILCIGSGLAAQQSEPSSTQNPAPVIKSSVNEVLVPVVARDAHGDAIGNLTKEEFQIWDNGKPQEITGFTLLSRGQVNPVAGHSTTDRIAPQSDPKPASAEQRFVVLLFDTMNLSNSELMQAQNAAAKVLDKFLPASDMAAVVSTSGANSGFTSDRAMLRQAILKLRANDIYRHSAQDCPNVDYNQADRIINKNDEQALQVAAEDALACARLSRQEMAVALQMAIQASHYTIATGDQNARANLQFLRLVVSKMGGLPGQRILILVSSGFLTATAEASALKSQVLDAAAQADVTINALDARGLYTTSPDASTSGGPNALGVRLQMQYRQESMSASGDVMSELADGTGGTYFHNNSDLENGMGNLLAGPRFTYLLTFSAANVKPNGVYHKLKVKVNHGGVTLQARHGYVAPKPGKKN